MIGILLANTGSPDAPTPPAVRRYLAQFLGDRRIIELPRWAWLPLLHGIILNVRPRRSARLYQRVWLPEGAPLLVYTRRLAASLAQRLATEAGGPYQVEIGMRYGSPSIAAGLRALRQAGAGQIIVLPLFPQYSATTSGTIFDAVFAELLTWRRIPGLRLVEAYFDHPAYLEAAASQIGAHFNAQGAPDRLLFSFHGIPAGYAAQGDPYPDQCRATAAALARRLGLPPEGWQVSFQSRFGPQEWLRPYTHETLQELGRAGLKRLAVDCPGFAVECLETLDEIAHEGREMFLKAGGGQFEYLPALNDTSAHVQALKEIILGALGAACSHTTSPG